MSTKSLSGAMLLVAALSSSATTTIADEFNPAALFNSEQPKIVFTLKNTYQGETYPITSEHWEYHRTPCAPEEFEEWFKAATTIAALDMKDYEVGYSDLSMDVLVMGPDGTSLFQNLNRNDLTGLSIAPNMGSGSPLYHESQALVMNSGCLIA